MIFYVKELSTNDKNSWQEILKWGCERIDTFRFALQPIKSNWFWNKDKSQSKYQIIQNQISLEFKSSIRWFYEQNKNTTFIEVPLNPITKKFVESVENLGEWTSSDLEDPCFIYKNEIVIWTISHENLVFINKNYIDSGFISKLNIKPDSIVEYNE